MKRLLEISLFFGLLTNSQITLATVSISTIEGASNIASSTTPIIYGGTAGDPSGCTGTGTCNTCVQTAAAGLLACNLRQVTPDTIVRIYFASDAKDGKALLTKEDGVTIIGAGSSTVITKGQTGYIQVTWSDICSKVTSVTYDGGLTGMCRTVAATETNGTVSFRLGMDVSPYDGKLDSTDDYTTGSFKIQVKIADEVSGTTGSASAASNGIYEFSVYPGDEKVYLEDIISWDGFPTSADGINYRTVHLLAVPGLTTCTAAQFGNSFVDPGSGKVKSSSLDSEGDLPDERFLGYENETSYMFKVAIEDDAGNIGLFTPDSLCLDAKHIARPGEVLGLLKEQQNCFIATAAYGSALEPRVQMLRSFRDRVLIPNRIGKEFVRWYYNVSPELAKKIRANATLKSATQVLLWPITAIVAVYFSVGSLGLFAITFAVFIIVWLTWQRRRLT